MKEIKHFLYLTIVVFSNITCSGDPSAGNSNDFVGVAGVLDARVRKQSVSVSRALNLDVHDGLPDPATLFISGADVTISTDNHVAYLTEFSSGFYETDSTFIVVPGQTYRIDVKVPDGRTLWAVTTVPFAPVLDPASKRDSMIVLYTADTTFNDSTYTVHERVVSDPVTFLWNGVFDGGYHFSIDDDTIWVNGDLIENPSRPMFTTGWIISTASMTLLDNHQINGRLWRWFSFIPRKENYEVDASVRILVMNPDYFDHRRHPETASNIHGGFGYWGAVNFYKRRIHVSAINIKL